jgi:hypothetical protein
MNKKKHCFKLKIQHINVDYIGPKKTDYTNQHNHKSYTCVYLYILVYKKKIAHLQHKIIFTFLLFIKVIFYYVVKAFFCFIYIYIYYFLMYIHWCRRERNCFVHVNRPRLLGSTTTLLGL